MRQAPERERWEVTWLEWVLIAIVGALLLMAVCGCGAVRTIFGGNSDVLAGHATGETHYPALPEPSFKQSEATREAARFSADVLDRVYVSGAPAAAALVGKAADAAEAVSAQVGAPAEPIALPAPDVDWCAPSRAMGLTVLAAEKTLARLGREALDYGKRMATWDQSFAERQAMPVERSWGIGSPMLAGIISLVVVAGGGYWLLRTIWKYRKVAFQTFLGVRAFLTTATANGASAQAEALKTELSKAQDASTKAAIDAMEVKVGDKP